MPAQDRPAGRRRRVHRLPPAPAIHHVLRNTARPGEGRCAAAAGLPLRHRSCGWPGSARHGHRDPGRWPSPGPGNSPPLGPGLRIGPDLPGSSVTSRAPPGQDAGTALHAA
ncbi:hypothetical protein G6F57_013564 [Rhizopus arrhizus]|nr:hypothetical protein G6F31_015081 [Rhizopus arrhizus]KAG1172151.1 hypothetical protein G6F35_016953 [Rhizopus arrhizus]KAG1255443.1 hypothetical protein G6F68_010377 [Rhizopus microsporus]KAG1464483.1 hypothetical protein G6F57_013564 [Rhizopus arrhizus]